MTDKQVQEKLDQMTRLANELSKEAKRRYGREACLFFESEGAFHILSEVSYGSCRERQEAIKFTSAGYANMECGSW